MNKLWLIIKREYLTRVKKKSFILTTLLTPLGIGLLIAVSAYLMSYEGDETSTIAIVDPSNVLNRSIADTDNIYFKFEDRSIDELKSQYEELEYDGIVLVPKIDNVKAKDFTSFYYSNDKLSPNLQLSLTSKMRDAIREYKVQELGFDQNELDALKTSVSIDPEPIEEGGEDQSSMASGIAAGIGGFMGFFMYFAVFFYGMMVMRSVMEEKTNRIVEIMISSVKPFQLMLGKILGVGAVGLTQLLIWAILFPLISFGVTAAFGLSPEESATMVENSGVDMEESMSMITQIMAEIKAQNWWMMIPTFLIFFLGGFFLYASTFDSLPYHLR